MIPFLILLIAVNMSYGSDARDECSMRTTPIHQVNVGTMPEEEWQVIEQYGDEEGKAMPVIFRGGVNGWGAAVWTPEYFAKFFGDAEIIVVSQKVLEEGVDYDHNSNLRSINPITMTMKEHIKNITLNPKNAGYFFGQLGHNFKNEELMKDIDCKNRELMKNTIFLGTQLDLKSQTRFPKPVTKGDSGERSYFVFIGSGNTVTSLHSHGSTFLAQIYGRKLATLVDPKYIEKCSCKWEGGGKFVSRCAIDILKPDFEKYPELRDIEVHQTILEAGDVLYIPEGWLHDIRGLSTSINIASGF